MEPTSYGRIRSIFEKHAAETCAHVYELNEESGARRCLLGWMAADSGVRLPSESHNTHVLGMRGTGRFARELQSEYGLSSDQLRQIQRANDESTDPARLMKLVSSLLETWSSGPVPSDRSDTRRLVGDSALAEAHRAVQLTPPG